MTLAGRGGEAKAPLDEALKVSHDLKNDALTAQTLNFQGDALFYSGDLKGAKPLYKKALRAAEKSKDRERILISKD